MIRQYPSVAALRAHYIDIVQTTGKSEPWGITTHSMDSWFNNETYDDTIRKATVGNIQYVPEAEKLMEKLDLQIETPHREWQASVAGAFPCVPDAIMGRPQSMRRPVLVPNQYKPINIICVTDSSGGIDAKTLVRRGAAIMALTMAMTRIRPVTLKLCGIGNSKSSDPSGETITTAPINTTPLDLATAAYFFSSAGFARRLIYRVSEYNGGDTGSWPKKMNFYDPTKYYEYLAKTLTGDTKSTLVIGPARLGDELLSKPIEWIQDQIRRFTEINEEAA